MSKKQDLVDKIRKEVEDIILENAIYTGKDSRDRLVKKLEKLSLKYLPKIKESDIKIKADVDKGTIEVEYPMSLLDFLRCNDEE